MKKLSGNKKTKTAVFISGRGSNLKNLIKFSKFKNSPIKVDLVISGGYGESTPSTIVKCTKSTPEILREGKGNTNLFE